MEVEENEDFLKIVIRGFEKSIEMIIKRLEEIIDKDGLIKRKIEKIKIVKDILEMIKRIIEDN